MRLNTAIGDDLSTADRPTNILCGLMQLAAETGIEDEDGGLGAGDREGTMARSGEEIDLHDSAAKCQSPIPPESR